MKLFIFPYPVCYLKTSILSLLFLMCFSSLSIAQDSLRRDLRPDLRPREFRPDYRRWLIPSFNQNLGNNKKINVKLVILGKESVDRFQPTLQNRYQIFNGQTRFTILSNLENPSLLINIPGGNNIISLPKYIFSENIGNQGITNIPDVDVPPNCIRGKQHIDITSPSFSVLGNMNYLNRYRVGLLYNFNSIGSDEIRSINVNRNPIKLFSPNSSSASIEIQNPNPANEDQLNTAIQQLKASIPTISPQIDFSKLEEVYTREEFYLKITAGGKCPIGTIDAMFSNNESNENHWFYYDFQNEMFTIQATPPNGNHFFKNKSDSIQFHTTSAFLKQVTYGRRLIIAIETEKSLTDLKAKIEATFRKGLYEANASLTYEQRKLRESLKMTALVIGGDGNTGSAIALANFDEARNLILKYIEDRNINKALPISMAFTDLNGNNIATQVKPSQDIPYGACFNVKNKLKIEVANLTARGKDFDLSGRAIIRVKDNLTNTTLPYDGSQNEYMGIPGDIEINDGTVYNLSNIIRYCNIETIKDYTIQLGADYMDRRWAGDEYYRKFDNDAPIVFLRGNQDSILNKIAQSQNGVAEYYIEYGGSNGAILGVRYRFSLTN
jgi:Thiol-activated cytolysin